MEVIGASQPDVEMEVNGASQPVVAEPCASSSSAWDPDVPSVVWEILELGRFPRRKNNPANDTEIREDNLAKTLYKQKKKIPAEWWEKVQLLKKLPASELMREVRQLGHYPDFREQNGLYKRVGRARSAVLFQPADEAELEELQWQAQREKQEATQREKQKAALQVAARAADAETELRAMFGDPLPKELKFGDPMFGTIEWLQFLGKKGFNDVLQVMCEWEGVDKKSLGKAPTAHHMIREIVKKRLDKQEQMDLLTAVAEQIKEAIGDVSETPSFVTGTFQVLSQCIKDDAENSKLESVRRELINALTDFAKRAKEEKLDLRPYCGDPACSLFLTWCMNSKAPERKEHFVSLPTESVFLCWVLLQMLDDLAPFIDDCESDALRAARDALCAEAFSAD